MTASKLIDFTKVREATSFEDVLSWYNLSPAKPGSRQIKINCPFHEDSTPSCSINLDRGIFKCFGCQAGGNVLDFIAQMEDTPEDIFNAAKIALEIIGGDAADFRRDGQGAQKPQKGRRAPKKPDRPRSAPIGQKTPQDGSQSASEDADHPTEVTENPVKDIQLDLEPEHPFLLTRNVPPDLAEQFGMGICRKGIMRNRIAIPLHNADGQPLGFVGRWAEEGDLPEGEEKYKLPKGFKKSLELFNLHRAAAMRNLLGHKFVVVVEGIWSTTRLHAAGVPVVALLGTSLSDTQAAKIAAAGFRFAVVILDGDEPGREATVNVVHVLSQHVYVKTVVLPEGVKPDTMDDAIVNQLVRK